MNDLQLMDLQKLQITGHLSATFCLDFIIPDEQII